MTLEKLVLERINVDFSNNVEHLKLWDVTSEEKLIVTRLLSLIPDKDKEILRQQMLKEKDIVLGKTIKINTDLINAQTVEKHALLSELKVK